MGSKSLLRQVVFWVAGIALAAVVAGPASAGVITFNSQPVGLMVAGSSFTEAGFTVTAVPGDPGDEPNIVNIGGTNLNVAEDGNPNDVFGTELQITATGAGLFSLSSIDVGNLGTSGAIGVFCGFGFRIELTDNLGDCADYGPGSGPLTTESPAGFSNISFLDVNLVSASPEQIFAVDNINLTPATTPVPEPSTFLLCFTGLGLAGIGIYARRLRAVGEPT